MAKQAKPTFNPKAFLATANHGRIVPVLPSTVTFRSGAAGQHELCVLEKLQGCPQESRAANPEQWHWHESGGCPGEATAGAACQPGRTRSLHLRAVPARGCRLRCCAR